MVAMRRTTAATHRSSSNGGGSGGGGGGDGGATVPTRIHQRKRPPLPPSPPSPPPPLITSSIGSSSHSGSSHGSGGGYGYGCYYGSPSYGSPSSGGGGSSSCSTGSISPPLSPKSEQPKKSSAAAMVEFMPGCVHASPQRQRQQQQHVYPQQPSYCQSYGGGGAYYGQSGTVATKGHPAMAASRRATLWTFSIFALFLVSVGLYAKYSALTGALEALASERDDLLERQSSSLDQTRLLESKLNAAVVAENQKEAELAQLREENLKELGLLERERRESERLRDEIGRLSRREVISRYGPGPYRVELKLTIPTDTPTHDALLNKDIEAAAEGMFYSDHYLVLEMAPLSSVPHAVSTFLNQVDEGLWDGTEFWRNRDHILMTRLEDPSTVHPLEEGQPSGKPSKMDMFHSADLHEMSYSEYSSTEGWNHEKYTLGFAGHPPYPGPLFYINKSHNAQHHSPRPSEGYGGDPCFARVVQGSGGHELVDRISDMERDDEDALIRPVRIKEAYVLVWQEDEVRDETSTETRGRWVHHRSR